MGLDFNKIKSLFIRPSDDEAKNTDKKENDAVDDSKKQGTDVLDLLNKDKGSQPENAAGAVSASVDQKIFDSLIRALEEKNLPGEDYMEYVGALRAMETIPLEDAVKVQTVLATLSTRGLTREKIIESAGFYLKVLDDEKMKFNRALDKQKGEHLRNLKEHITAMEGMIKTKSDQIAQLTKEITESQKEIETLKVKIAENEKKIGVTEKNFLLTHEFVTGQINENVNKLKSSDQKK